MASKSVYSHISRAYRKVISKKAVFFRTDYNIFAQSVFEEVKGVANIIIYDVEQSLITFVLYAHVYTQQMSIDKNGLFLFFTFVYVSIYEKLI